MAETAFRIAYEGPALESGRMPVRDLAPALLALGELFTEASTVLYPERGPAALSIKATDVGSFEAQLVLEAKRVWDQVVDIFGGDGATAIVNLKDAILSVGGLYMFIRHVRRRRIAKRHALRPGWVRITLEDGEEFDAPADAFRLFERATIRERVRESLEPLAREGVEQVTFRPDDDTEPVIIRTEDLTAFDPAGEVTEVGEEDREMVLQIATLAFVQGNKWRLTDGASVFWASIEDTGFLGRIEQGERFGKGDTLRCLVRVVQTQDALGELHAEYRVLRVLEHVGRPQMSFEEPPDAESAA